MLVKIIRGIALLLLGISIGIAAAILAGSGRVWWYANKMSPRQALPTSSPSPVVLNAPPQPDSLTDKDRVDLYGKRADDLERLLSLLITISTVYAIVLGLGAYAQVKDSASRIEKLEESLSQEAEKTKNEVLRIFPLFEGIESQMTRTMNVLLGLLPRIDIAQKRFDDLSASEKEAVFYYEKSIAATELFNVRSFKDKRSGIFHVLGNFYALKYVASDRKDGELLQRSLFYLELAIHLDPTNVGALNDRGYIALRIYQTENRDEALRYYTESVAADPEQQRARYNMAWIYHKNGNYTESIATVTEALSKIKWQLASDKARLSDLRYHRACSRAREECKKPPAKRNFEAVFDDLEEILRNESTDWPNIIAAFKEDIKEGGDLFEAINSGQRGQKIAEKFLNLHRQR